MVGVSMVALGNWEVGVSKPSMDALVALAKTLSMSLDELVGVSFEKPLPTGCEFVLLTSGERRLMQHFRACGDAGREIVLTVCRMEAERERKGRTEKPPHESERYIPLYLTPSAAGFSVPLDGEDFEMVLVDAGVPQDADYAVRIQGHSMEPYLPDGSTAFVKKTNSLSTGDVGIFAVDGAMYCKQYLPRPDGGALLASLNPALRALDVVIAADSGSSVRICGRVLLAEKPPLMW